MWVIQFFLLTVQDLFHATISLSFAMLLWLWLPSYKIRQSHQHTLQQYIPSDRGFCHKLSLRVLPYRVGQYWPTMERSLPLAVYPLRSFGTTRLLYIRPLAI